MSNFYKTINIDYCGLQKNKFTSGYNSHITYAHLNGYLHPIQNVGQNQFQGNFTYYQFVFLAGMNLMHDNGNFLQSPKYQASLQTNNKHLTDQKMRNEQNKQNIGRNQNSEFRSSYVRYDSQIQKQNLFRNTNQIDVQSKGQGLRKNYDRNPIQEQTFKKSRRYAYIKSTCAQKNISQRKQQSIDCIQNDQMQKYQTKSGDLFGHTDSSQKRIANKDQQIKNLRQELIHEKQKFQNFQQSTLKNQIKILDTINDLQQKLKQLKTQNIDLQKENNQLKHISPSQSHQDIQLFKTQLNRNYSFNQESDFIQSLKEQLQQKSFQLANLSKQYKKVKGIGKGLVDMMKKVDNLNTPQGQNSIQFAWKWIKKVVWEYEAIRKKAFTWKKAFDQLQKQSEDQNSLLDEQ